VDLEHERRLTQGNWAQILADMKTVKISLKANARTNALGFVIYKQGANLLKSKSDLEHDVRVLLGGMANEELFLGEDGTTNGAHNDITRVTQLLYHAVGEMGMYRKTRLNFGSLTKGRSDGGRELDAQTRSLMEAQSERLYSEARAVLMPLKALTEHLVGRLLQAGEMGLVEALSEIRSFEALQAG
jgi:cell division protease FtsH